MDFIGYLIAGLSGGILGGMGMGGGTALIPLLSIFFSMNQHSAQAINLLAFLPMAVIALVIHTKNKLVDYKGALFIIIPGVITCALGSLLADAMGGGLLRRLFGGFLIVLAVFGFLSTRKKNGKAKKD